MGYANTSILIYGIKIKGEEYLGLQLDNAKLLYDKFKVGEHNDINSYPKINKIVPIKELQRKKQTTGNGYIYYVDRYFSQLLSIGTDSRSDDLFYEKGCDHIFGLEIASNGYGTNDDIADFINPKVKKRAKTLFDKYLKPILKDIGLKDIKDKFHIINQVH